MNGKNGHTLIKIRIAAWLCLLVLACSGCNSLTRDYKGSGHQDSQSPGMYEPLTGEAKQ